MKINFNSHIVEVRKRTAGSHYKAAKFGSDTDSVIH